MLKALLIVVPNLLFASYAIMELTQDWMGDLFIYREGARLGWQGRSPYSVQIREAVAARYPEKQEFIANCGYFLPPQAIVLLGPLAALPWPAAQAAYAILCGLSLIACWWGLCFAFRKVPVPKWIDVPPLVVWLVMVHSVIWFTYAVGQTSILVCGAIAIGQILHQRGRCALGNFFWAAAFLKPHLALALLPLAFYLNGWRRVAGILIWLGLLNLAGCLLAGGTPLFAFDYLKHLGDGHKNVIYNRVEWNAQVTSWNALVVSLGGPPIEFDGLWTLANYAVLLSVVVIRCDAFGIRPTPAWAVAMAASGALFCCQVLGYEACLLVFLIPLILERHAANRQWDVAVLLLLIIGQSPAYMTLHNLGLAWFRPWLIAATVVWLLARPGPAHSVATQEPIAP